MNTKDPYFTEEAGKQIAFTPHVYEVHGKVAYMHCTNEKESHATDFFECPSLNKFEEYSDKLH